MDPTAGDGATTGDGGTTGDGATAGDGEPAADIRASDAERDATLQRLSLSFNLG